MAIVARVVRFAAFELDRETGELRQQGLRVKVERQPLQVLEMLLERPGRLVTREELKQRLWPSDTFVDFENSINAAVRRLRDALDDSASRPRFIETLPRRGYRFIYPVEGVAPVGASRVPWWRQRWAVAGFIVIAGAVALSALLATNVAGLRSRLFGTMPGPIHSIAVLPFKNNTGDPAQDPLVDGLTDALTTELAQVRSLRVISVTSAMTYKGQSKRLPEIARELNVDAVVEGSVLRSGEQLWVNVQLLQARTDSHLWANTYQRRIQESPALLAGLARDIIARTKVQLSDPERSRLAREQAINPEAYAAYRKAREIWWSKITEEGYWKSIELYRQAIANDANFADAYAGLALSFHFLRQLYPTREVETELRVAAAKALELDPSLSVPHAVLASRAALTDPAGAEREFRVALELNANDAIAHLLYAWFLNGLARHEEALAEIRRAEQLDPLSPFVSSQVILGLNYLRRYEEALQQGHRALELNPDFWVTYFFLGGSYWQLKRYDEAIQTWEKSLACPGVYEAWPLTRLVETYLRVGRKAEALKALARLEEISRQRYVEPYNLALAFAAAGRKNDAINVLQQAQREGTYNPRKFPRQFAGYLGDDPRYQQILRNAGVSPPAKRAPN